uniref:ATP synthase complex subunit 8 n=1 Tax=Zebrias zebrinus TaxID=1302775 RepID=A0A088B145_ZEBZB|nr:ATP synthase F0 subunit 8 [Zebrias zebrinus]AGH27476.1 ATP synthase subunit 8 [Zebrias zebrinus]
MPQLNPTPWFTFLVLAWLVFFTIMPSKLLSYWFPNEPTSPDSKIPNSNPQSWLWF